MSFHVFDPSPELPQELNGRSHIGTPFAFFQKQMGMIGIHFFDFGSLKSFTEEQLREKIREAYGSTLTPARQANTYGQMRNFMKIIVPALKLGEFQAPFFADMLTTELNNVGPALQGIEHQRHRQARFGADRVAVFVLFDFR